MEHKEGGRDGARTREVTGRWDGWTREPWERRMERNIRMKGEEKSDNVMNQNDKRQTVTQMDEMAGIKEYWEGR